MTLRILVYKIKHAYKKKTSKAGFLFAAAGQVPKLMTSFEKEVLRKYTPCTFASSDEVVTALAVVHTELVLIHPFREGNGRLARMLTMLMAFQAKLPPLDFGIIRGQKRKEYFSAVQAGLDRNYGLSTCTVTPDPCTLHVLGRKKDLIDRGPAILYNYA
jgi:cell filamentation protein